MEERLVRVPFFFAATARRNADDPRIEDVRAERNALDHEVDAVVRAGRVEELSLAATAMAQHLLVDRLRLRALNRVQGAAQSTDAQAFVQAVEETRAQRQREVHRRIARLAP